MKYFLILISLVILANARFNFIGEITLTAIYSSSENKSIVLEKADVNVEVKSGYSGPADQLKFCFLNNHEDLRKYFSALNYGASEFCMTTNKNLCNESATDCYFVNSTGVTMRLTHTIANIFDKDEFKIDDETRKAFIRSRILRESYHFLPYLYDQKIIFLCLKRYFSRIDSKDIEDNIGRVDTHFIMNSDNYINDLETIFGAEMELGKDNNDKNLDAQKELITIFLTVLKEKLNESFEISFNQQLTQYLGPSDLIDKAISAVMEDSKVKNTTEEINKVRKIFNESNKQLYTALVRVKIQELISLVENYKVDREQTNTNIKAIILLKLFYKEYIKNYVPRGTFLGNFITMPLFASFFTKSVLCQIDSLNAFNILKGRSTKLEINQVTDHILCPGHEMELNQLSQFDYGEKIKKYLKSTLDSPLEQLSVILKRKLKKRFK
jgi:hypothetical protein